MFVFFYDSISISNLCFFQQFYIVTVSNIYFFKFRINFDASKIDYVSTSSKCFLNKFSTKHEQCLHLYSLYTEKQCAYDISYSRPTGKCIPCGRYFFDRQAYEKDTFVYKN